MFTSRYELNWGFKQNILLFIFKGLKSDGCYVFHQVYNSEILPSTRRVSLCDLYYLSVQFQSHDFYKTCSMFTARYKLYD